MRLAPRRRTVLFGAVLAVALTACGGATGGRDARSADDTEGGGGYSDSDGYGGDYEASGSEARRPERPPCEDGGCMPCGEGICPDGFFCDENAAGGPACGWLPQCASEPSCSCLEKNLGSGCDCAERDGGQAVTCE